MRIPIVRRGCVAVLAALGLVLVPVAGASHQFTDVPTNHPFHTEISIFKDANITSGCTATTFCPDDFVKRQAMAAFIDRALGLVVRPGESTPQGVAGSRIAMLDDGSSLVRTNAGALELGYGGFRGLRLEGNATSSNVIGGYDVNSVTPGATAATIAGGGSATWQANRVTDDYGVVSGGAGNRAGNDAGTLNDAWFGTVVGGLGNTASGAISTVGGGRLNTASGNLSFVAGNRAKALHTGAFVWADTTAEDFSSTQDNQFLVRASAGARFVRGGSTFTGTNAALQAEHNGTNGEAAWFRLGSSSSTLAVEALVKQEAGTGNFLECWNQSGASMSPKCHISSAGTFVAGSDFAESLPAASAKQRFHPGDVLVISARHEGAVERSRRAADPAVIGVYSTRPAVLGADKGGITRVGSNDVPVAITGIVPVKASAENGAIRPGDLLVSARTPGRAMRAGSNPRIGTVVGKALQSLRSKRGTIEVLVMQR